MKISRRDILKLAGGSALGFILSPIPYKLLDDSSIWTQSWGPKPLHGESTFRYAPCTLCPAGCGLRVRCIGAQPVGMSVAVADPLSHGAACPVGLSGHHLASHPARVMQPMRLTRTNGLLTKSPISLKEAIGEVANAIRNGGKVGLLDAQPGRAISNVYSTYMSGLPHGTYITGQAASSFDVLRRMMNTQSTFGYDIENTKTILSFGAPLFEGWGTPGRLLDRIQNNNAPTIIQVETRMSNTAIMADTWLAVNPGTEGALALGLAHVLIGNGLFDRKRTRYSDDFQKFFSLVQGFTPPFVAGLTGISEKSILETAKTISAGRPTIAIGGGNPGGGPLGARTEQAIWALNLLLGSVGTKGGVLQRRHESSQGQPLESVPDGSLNVLIIDGAESGAAIPWAAVEKKLAITNNLILSLSPYSVGMTRHADIVIPSPAFLEMTQDSPTTFDLPFDTFSIAPPICNQPDGVTSPLETIKAIAALTGGLHDEIGSNDDLIRSRADNLHARGGGRLISMKEGTAITAGSADEFWKQLQEGAVWIDEAGKEFPPARFSFMGNAGDMHELGIRRDSALVVMPYGWQAVSGNAAVSPILSKLCQESDLFSSATTALINPGTARTRGWNDGAIVTIQTPGGEMRLRVSLDPTVMHGVVHVAVGPQGSQESYRIPAADTILAICSVRDDGSWRVTPVLET